MNMSCCTKTPMFMSKEAGLMPATTERSDTDALDTKATSLRRAATVLLIFSMTSLNNIQGWFGMIAAISVLLASSAKVQTRYVKGFAICAAICAFLASIGAIFVVVAIRKMGHREIHNGCVKMPGALAIAFDWGSRTLVAAHAPQMNATEMLDRKDIEEHLGKLDVLVKIFDVPVKIPEQEAFCDHFAHKVADLGSALVMLFALFQFALFVSAIVVTKRSRVLEHSYRSLACEPAVINP
jgi:hypothetical protein